MTSPFSEPLLELKPESVSICSCLCGHRRCKAARARLNSSCSSGVSVRGILHFTSIAIYPSAGGCGAAVVPLAALPGSIDAGQDGYMFCGSCQALTSALHCLCRPLAGEAACTTSNQGYGRFGSSVVLLWTLTSWLVPPSPCPHNHGKDCADTEV